MGKITKSIKAQLILVTALVVAIPLAIAIVLSSISTMNQGIKNVDKMNTVQVNLIEQDIKAMLNENINVLKTFASAQTTIEYLSGDETKKGQVESQMYKVNDAFNDDNVIAITDTNGDQLCKTKGDKVNVADREYFKIAMGGEVYVSDIQVSKSNGERIATFAVPIWDMDEENVIGVVQRNCNLNIFHELLKKELNEEKMEIVIVDRTGSVLAHSSHEIDPENPEDQSMNQFYTDSRGDKTNGFYSTVWKNKKWMISWRKEEKTGWVIACCRLRSVALKSTWNTAFAQGGLGLAEFVIAIIIVTIYASRLASPIKKISVAASTMAEGDFTIKDVKVKTRNEVGSLATAFNTMKNNIAEVLEDAQNSAGLVANSTQQFSAVSEQSADALQSIAEGATTLASGAADQKTAVVEASSMVDSMVNSIREVKENSISVMDASNKVSDDAAEGQQKLEDAVNRMNELKESIEHTDEVIRELAEHSKKIGSIVETISNISEQTNLLSLNASIEAARAGEAGRGFAVVATEVGSLAIESKDAVSEIAGIVNEIQQRTIAATRSMSVGTEQTAESAEIVEDAAKTFSEIAKEISTLSGRIQESVAISEESMSAGERVKEAIEQVEGIANNIVDSTSMISASTEQQTASVQEIASTSKDMYDVADGLKAQIGKFKLTEELDLYEGEFTDDEYQNAGEEASYEDVSYEDVSYEDASYEDTSYETPLSGDDTYEEPEGPDDFDNM